MQGRNTVFAAALAIVLLANFAHAQDTAPDKQQVLQEFWLKYYDSLKLYYEALPPELTSTPLPDCNH